MNERLRTAFAVRAISEWLGVLALVLVCLVAFLVANQRDELKKQAVERGCAEWVVKSDGSTTWQWKEGAK